MHLQVHIRQGMEKCLGSLVVYALGTYWVKNKNKGKQTKQEVRLFEKIILKIIPNKQEIQLFKEKITLK
jgi:hypothetical protein